MLTAETAELLATMRQLGRDYAALCRALRDTIAVSRWTVRESQRKRRWRQLLASQRQPPRH